MIYQAINTIDGTIEVFPSWNHLINHLSLFNRATGSSSYSNRFLEETGVNDTDVFYYFGDSSDFNLNWKIRQKKPAIIKQVGDYHYLMRRFRRLVDENGNNVYDYVLLREVINHKFDETLEHELDVYWKRLRYNRLSRSDHYYFYHDKSFRYRIDPIPYTGHTHHYYDYFRHPRHHRNMMIAANPDFNWFGTRWNNWKNIHNDWNDEFYRDLNKSWKRNTRDKKQWMHNVRGHSKKADWYEDVA